MLRHVINVLDRTLAWLGGTTLLLMMFLTFFDVIGRYVFGRPIAGAFELTEILLAVTVFAAMPSVTQQDSHIKLDFLDVFMSEFVRKLIDSISAAVMTGALFLLGYAVWIQGSRMARAGLHSDILGLPTYIVVYFISILLVLSAVFLIGRIVFGIVSVTKGSAHL